jgi:Cupredoxin-like domain
MRGKTVWAAGLGLVCLSIVSAAHAEDYVVTIKGRQFEPKDLVIPANTQVKVTVKNLDSEPAEFESTDLNREKIVTPGKSITVLIGPLSPGTYNIFDDFHHDTTTGTITAR